MENTIYTTHQIYELKERTDLIAICLSGKEYDATFCPEYPMIFFLMPAAEMVIGYRIK